jgi:hypothetical protein
VKFLKAELILIARFGTLNLPTESSGTVYCVVLPYLFHAKRFVATYSGECINLGTTDAGSFGR